MKVTLALTHRCNLSCKYCYAGRKFEEDMSFETARKVVDFAMDITPPEQRIEFCFFGGEPLLCFDLIREMTGYVRKTERKVDIPVRFSITTNGTLLNQQVIDFLKDENCDLCISIDGPEHIHDLNRRYKDGRGSFMDVARNLHKASRQLDNVQVNAVYGPGTIDFLPATVSFFIESGLPVIHLNPDICASWVENAYQELPDVYMQIAELYVQSYRHKQEVAVNLIDSKIIVFFKDGYGPDDRCGMGETEWGFAPSGNIYPCERFIGEDVDSSVCLGNIHTGLDLKRRCSLLRCRGNRNEECRTCSLRKYCMNWCGCTNYYMTGKTDLAGPMLCMNEKAAIQAATHVFDTLTKEDNALFLDHFMRYLHEGRHY
jgi:uncharacterized protein